MSRAQYYNRAVAVGAIVGIVAVQLVWLGPLRLAFRDLFTPLLVVEFALPPFVAGLVAGGLRRTDRSDDVAVAGIAAGGLAVPIGFFLGHILAAIGSVVLSLADPLAGIEWLMGTLADLSVPSLEPLGTNLLGLAFLPVPLFAFFIAGMIPGLLGGLVAHGVRTDISLGSSPARAEEVES